MKQHDESPHPPGKDLLTLRAGIIRDGTQGLSILVGQKLVGEWTDSRAWRLAPGDENGVKVLDKAGKPLYTFTVPGKVHAIQAVSETEVVITLELPPTG